ncbi:hypothetical protein PFISCL1PPCAC_3665 [Pristionchus fissidentatus]|uniref:Uncharacterized protein n=1 Tax=Pristionchus fissidentatus TaxID=1538716 RepID=A0AAV5V1S7_9BILA|nr:hypothetical protein PFISCL1PPCAC_3665 [Pristionchus fissidentatus]
MTALVQVAVLLVLSLLLASSNAVDLGEFNYTQFVDDIKKTAVDHRRLSLLQEGGDLRPAAEGVLHLADNQTAFVMQGRLGEHNLTFSNTSLELNSKGSW